MEITWKGLTIKNIETKIVYLFLFLLVAAISLSPRLSLGNLIGRRNIDIRAEDIVLGLGLIFWTVQALINGKRTIVLPSLFWPIIAWVALGIISVFSNLLLQQGFLDITFFYFVKELEFFILYLFAFSLLSYIPSVKPLIGAWIFFALINVGWIFLVMIFNISGFSYYGPLSFIEPQGPFPSGGFFLMLFVFLFNIAIFYYGKLKLSHFKKTLILIMCALPAVGVIASGSRTAVLGFAVSLILSVLIYLLQRRVSMARIIKIMIVGLIIIILFWMLISALGLSGRLLLNTNFGWEYGSNDPQSRIGILKGHIATMLTGPIFNFFIGYGVVGEAHSQYIRIFLERGVLGLLFFAWLMASILKTSLINLKNKEDALKNSLAIGLFIATIVMLVMGIANDVFMVVKPDEVYWVFTAMALVTIIKSKSKSAPNEGIS